MIAELDRWGCNTADALYRVLDDEEFYRECLTDVLSDACFGKLERSLAARDIEGAFNAAHTLKGVLANLGVTPMYDTVVRIVEPLRAGCDEGLLPIFAELLKERDYLAGILSKE